MASAPPAWAAAYSACATCTNATNQIDVEVPAGTLETFKAEVLNAYNNDRGGVIDWETGIATTASATSSSNNLITIANATFGAGGGNTLTATFGRPMELYTNNVNSQINVLSQEGSRQNALIPQGVANNALEYTITFSGADIGKLGAAMPSRSTYATGVDFQATATFSGGGSEILEFTIGGTPGAGDTFLYFAAPGSESITSLTVAFVDDNGQFLTDGQRRPILDDLGFILTPPANSFAAWVGDPAFGLNPNDQGFDDDPDGDGISNRLEAWFGTNPGGFSKGLTPGVVTSNTFTFSHPQNTNPLNDISASYQWSKDLVTFNSGEATAGDGTTVNFSSETNEGITRVTATVTGSAVLNLFVRVAAVQVP